MKSKQTKQVEAAERQSRRDKLSPVEQIQVLYARVGTSGARREVNRLAAMQANGKG